MKISGLILLACAAIASAAPLINNKSEGEAIPDSYIVVLKKGQTIENFRGRFNSIARRQNGRGRPALWERSYKHGLQGFSGSFSKGVLKELLDSPEVEYIEQDRIITVNAVQNQPPSWGLTRVSQRSPNYRQPFVFQNSAGSGVTAYVIDSGVLASHPEFEGRARMGPSFVQGSNRDDNGHGTHVAGTIAGARVGVAKRANVVGVKVLDAQGRGAYSSIMAGMDWVTKNARGTKAVVNMSLGGGKSNAVNSYANAMVNAGIPLFVAAGNERNVDACTGSPSSAEGAFTVAASDSADRFASFSSFGSCCDIIAPGVDIVSASARGGYESMSGTSMATPHVAGVAALVMSAENISSPNQVYGRLKQLATRNVVKGVRGNTPNLLLFNGAA